MTLFPGGQNRKHVLIFTTVFCSLLFCSSRLQSQSNIRDSSIAMNIVGINYGLQMPVGDMADRFGTNSKIGLDYSYKFKDNLFLGVNGGYIFGGKVKEDSILAGIANEQGLIIGNDGKFAEIRMFERGYYVSLIFGKLFTFKKPNPNSGILVVAGPEFMQHKISIQPLGNTVPQLDEQYRKGYDRLTNGVGLLESVAYYYFSNHYLVNFYFGFDFIQSFNENRRDFNYDTMEKDDKKRVDLLFGLKAGWMLPIYKKAPSKFYYE
jgi:hypothetical protein